MRHVIKDSIIIILSIVIAIAVAELDLIEKLLTASENIRIISSFVGGLFFTSVLTTAPAIVVLGKISLVDHVFVVAFVGALGAVCGDLLIFNLFNGHVSKDLGGISKRINLKTGFLRKGFFRWFGVLAGALIIASPFPDELGIAMMGLSRIKLKIFIPISFILNFLGILAIAFAARLLTV